MGWELIFTQAFLTTVLASGVRLATPILFTTLGEIFTERSGVLNLGLEGMMTSAAFGSFYVAFLTGNLWLGLLGGIISGGLMSLIMAFMSVKLKVNQVVTGLAINFFALGTAGFFFRTYFGVTTIPPRIEGFGATNIPFLERIPVIGPILFQQNFLVYVAIITVFICAFILYRTTIGLKIRSVGENPEAADTLGINVNRLRFLCVIFGGLMAGVGGSFLVLTIKNQTFMDYMVSGRGWIAIALVFFCRWDPYRALGGALLFGFVDAFQLQLQAIGVGVPYEFLLMLPYILTLVVLITASKAEAPASLCIPFKRGKG